MFRPATFGLSIFAKHRQKLESIQIKALKIIYKQNSLNQLATRTTT